jgi:beta-phosphoglucomutase-like phosphatase (HAD superfamily)
MIKNIIFDFDGVLVDSEMLVARSFSRYLSNRNINFTEQEFSVYAGKKTVQVIDELSNKFSIQNKEEFFEDIMSISNNIYSKELTPVNGAKLFLEQNHYNYFIGSNSIRNRILFGLKKVDFLNFFDIDKVFSFDMVEKPKPQPDIYLSAINTHQLDKKESVVIEDSAIGVQAGVAAGIKVIGLTAGGHWYTDRSAKELLDAGAIVSANSYESLLREIKKL